MRPVAFAVLSVSLALLGAVLFAYLRDHRLLEVAPGSPQVGLGLLAGTLALMALAVVRMERKGRSGKEATVIEKLALPAAELERWCKELKQALGCGGAVDGDVIVLQGDLRARLEPLLIARGVRKVTLG